MVEGIIISFSSIAITAFIVKIFIKCVKNLFNNIAETPNRHMSYDYYDETDGFYVTMQDGSVRID